jgi:hypothetical protein
MFISITQAAFLVLLHPYHANSQNLANTYQTKINGSIDNLNQWLHFGWRSSSFEHFLRFQDNNSLLVFGKRTIDYKPFTYHNESGWSYSEAYVEKLDGRLEKPVQPDFIITGFAIPVNKSIIKILNFLPKK